MHVCVGWCVKWNSLWRYTTLPSYNFIEWMISMIVTVRLWRHSNIVRIRPDLARLDSVQTLHHALHTQEYMRLGLSAAEGGKGVSVQ